MEVTARNRPVPVMRRLVALCAFAVIGLAACGGPDPADGLAPVVDAATIAATVNDEPIYTSDVQLEAEAQGITQPGELLETDSAEFHSVLDELIDIKLLALEAEARGLEDDPKVGHRLAAAREHILGNSLMDAIVSEKVDEAAIRKMYEAQVQAQVSAGQLGEETRVRHIVVESREAIDRVAADLRGGAEFAVIASQRSIDDSTKLEGGDLGFLTEDDASKLSAELAQAIKSTPTGSVSRPFQSGMGWHVIRVDERRPEQPPSLEELREPILQFMRTEQIDEALKQLRSEARIDRRGAPRDAPLDTDPFRLAPTESDDAAPPRPSPSVQASGARSPAQAPAASPPASAPAQLGDASPRPGSTPPAPATAPTSGTTP